MALTGFRGVEQKYFPPLVQSLIKVQELIEVLDFAFDSLLATMDDKTIFKVHRSEVGSGFWQFACNFRSPEF